MKSIEINKNNGYSNERGKNYLETDINLKKEKEKSSNKKYNTNVLINNINEKKIKYMNKKIPEIGLNINKNESNKYENDFNIENRRLKTEINNKINIDEDSKIKRTLNSKNNTTVNTITNNSKSHKNNNNQNGLNINNQKKVLEKKKTQKQYIVKVNGKKTRINIVACNRVKKNSKSIKKTTPRTNHKNKNIVNKINEIEKTKSGNIQIKTQGNINNDSENIIIIDKGLKTEIDLQQNKNKNYKIKKNHIKSSSNVNKINNLFEHNKYHRAFNLPNLPIDNIIGTRNFNKNCSNYMTTNNTSNNKSFNKNLNKHFNTGLILKNTNISNFGSNNVEQKMKVNTNPNMTNNKAKITSYNNIPRNKKELVTIRNTVFNFNIVNSSLIISSLNKKRYSNSNSFHFLNKKIKDKKVKKNNLTHINRTLNNANITIGDLNKNKSNDKIISGVKNYSSNTNTNKNNIINTIQKKDILNYSENVAKTENNDNPVSKIKNKLEKILLNKLKQNSSQDKKHIKYNSVKLGDYNRNKIRKNKIINKKGKIINKHNSNKSNTNSIFLNNKSISPTYKNIKTINNSEIDSNKLIYVQKQNQFLKSIQSDNVQKKLVKRWTKS